MSNINKQALRGQSVEGSYYLAECGHCGEMYPSNKLDGGESLFSGDYGECFCHLCGADDSDIADNGAWGSEAVTAWNYQQKRIEALLDENYRLTAERDALRENIGGDNTRAAADIYFQLVEECEIPAGGSLVEYVDDMREKLEAAEKRIAELESLTVPQLPQPAPVAVPDAMEMDDDFDSAFEHGKAVGWNAYRAAMLQAEPVSNSDELPLDYLQGHKDGLEWAAQLAEANHPQTGDWLYDDPIDLARAIRKGPDMPTVQAGNSPVTPDGWVMVPKEPTQAMIKAWLSEIANFRGHAAGYRAAIEAAPQLEVNRG